jgi:hypothetical protein
MTHLVLYNTQGSHFNNIRKSTTQQINKSTLKKLPSGNRSSFDFAARLFGRIAIRPND